MFVHQCVSNLSESTIQYVYAYNFDSGGLQATYLDMIQYKQHGISSKDALCGITGGVRNFILLWTILFLVLNDL